MVHFWLKQSKHGTQQHSRIAFTQEPKCSKQRPCNRCKSQGIHIEKYCEPNAGSTFLSTSAYRFCCSSRCYRWLADNSVSKRNACRHEEIWKIDEKSVFHKLTPDKTFKFIEEKCSGGKFSKARVTVLKVAKMIGKMKLVVIGNPKNHRCFKNFNWRKVLFTVFRFSFTVFWFSGASSRSVLDYPYTLSIMCASPIKFG